MKIYFRKSQAAATLALLCSMTLAGPASAGDGFRIDEAKWDREESRLQVKGKGREGRTVTVVSAASGEEIGERRIDDDEWRIRSYRLSPVPCRVRATQSDGRTDEKSVEDAPANCDDGNGGGNPPPLAGDFTVLAANDLGMHCADTDYRIFSILPPYNVLNAQVLQRGAKPRLMTRADGIEVTYHAVASNVEDPDLPGIATDSVTSTSQNSNLVYKGNFWEQVLPGDWNDPTKRLGFLAYQSLYPSGHPSVPSHPSGVLGLFPFLDDLGLPAPDLARLYLGDGKLAAEQAAMPGIDGPYVNNDPQAFHGYVEDLPFFVNFPFGYTVANFKRYTAEGIPIMPTDDQGRSNPYPLMRVEARDTEDNVLAAVDAVVPVASEADCQICHASQEVCSYAANGLVCDNIANDNYLDKVNFIDDARLALGDTPEQQVINAAKTNILRLHDHKFATQLAGDQTDGSFADGTTPNVVCANCHYSPALDLAHLGPNDDNGKEQTRHVSMSRAMHGYHGALVQNPDYDHLFPNMPLPDANGDRVFPDGQDQESVLQETCYNCHPGKRTQCLRGAMSDGGMVCQDCHGQLTQVGDDFSEHFATVPFPDGAVAKRVPWASEPQCESCHVGDVLQVNQLAMTGQLDDTVRNAADTQGNTDDLRLRMAYLATDHKDSGGPDDLPLLDFADSRFAANQALYRLSGGDDGSDKGHGGVSCENCHGSTHAIWPNANPWANDNRTAEGLQGHTGPIAECTTCHKGDLGSTLEGPHGMHPVGATRFAEDHEDLAERNPDACRACHGMDGEGTVLSRTAVERVLKSDEEQRDGSKRITLAKGEPVSCVLCHENEL